VLKTRTLGYDGKGQRLVRTSADADAAWRDLGSVPLIAERWIEFDRELSVIGVRSADGQIVVYPLTENHHSGGILRTSCAPALDGKLLDSASGYLKSMLNHLDYVGILALELFVTEQGLLANEFAPRVHNSGHWTIEGAATSQFENHVRAVLDMPLGDASAVAWAGMINLIGTMPPAKALAADFPVFLHDYGKAARPGRKLGHVTVLAGDEATRDARLRVLEKSIAD
jgi:5-(carboxyamino)imidazole ribonucleotide synthase